MKVDQVNNPPADSNSLKYTLLEIKLIQDIDNNVQFDINLKINWQNFITTKSGYKLLNLIEINCNTLCEELDSALENQDVVIGTFKPLVNNEIQLIALE